MSLSVVGPDNNYSTQGVRILPNKTSEHGWLVKTNNKVHETHVYIFLGFPIFSGLFLYKNSFLKKDLLY